MSNVRLWPAEWDEPFEIAGRRVDPVARTISHNDEVKSVEPRIIALLVALADKPLAVCRRDDLIKKIWPNSPGADQSLSNAMSLLRRALGDNGASGNQLIKTIPKLGYQLTVKVVRDKPPDASPRSPTRSRRFPAIIGMLTLIAVATAAILGFLTDRPDAGGQASDSRVTVAILPFSANEALLPKAMAMHDATRQLVDAAYDVRLLDYAETMLVSSGDLRPDWTIESTFEQVDGQIEAQITVVDIRSSDRIRDTVRASMGDTLTMRALVLASISESLNADRLPKRNSGLTGIVLAAPTNSLEAYDQFAIGRYHYLKYTDEGLATAIEYFTRATELDPQFGGAFSKLGDAYLLAGSHQGFMEPAEAYPKARDALLRAVTLSPDNALALASIGDYYACIESDLELAGRAFDRALKTQPDLLHTGITRYYMLTGREAEGFASVERSLAAFPDSNWEQVIAAHQYLAFGDSKRALELAQAALDRNDESSEAIFVRSLALAELGNTGRAIESFTPLISESRTTPRFKLTYASLLARDNQVDAARQMISLARSGGGRVTETHLAMAYGWLKDADTAFKWLDKAIASREFGLCYLPFSPLWHPLRDDPRFDRILASRYPNLVASTSR